MVGKVYFLCKVVLWGCGLVALEGMLSSFEPAWSLFIPGFCLVPVLILAHLEQSAMGAFAVFLLGLLVDCNNAATFLGPWAAAYLLVYLAVLILPRTLLSRSFLTLAALSFVFSLASDFLYEMLTFQSWSVLLLLGVPALVRAVGLVLSMPLIVRFFAPDFYSQCSGERRFR